MATTNQGNKKFRRYTLTQDGKVLISTVRATSIARIAEWLHGKLISSCPGWGLIQVDNAFDFYGVILHGEISVHLR